MPVNMSYCRFRNTLKALQECFDNMDENLSAEESKARELLIALCSEIAAEYVQNDDLDLELE